MTVFWFIVGWCLGDAIRELFGGKVYRAALFVIPVVWLILHFYNH